MLERVPLHLFQPAFVFAVRRFAAAGSLVCVPGGNSAPVFSHSVVLDVSFLVILEREGRTASSNYLRFPSTLLTALSEGPPSEIWNDGLRSTFDVMSALITFLPPRSMPVVGSLGKPLSFPQMRLYPAGSTGRLVFRSG